MKIQRRSGKDERRILTGMVVNRVLLGRLAAKWQRDLFRSRWANIVAGWCVKFYEDYQEAPKGELESLFDSWAVEADDATVELVERFLDSLSDEYEQLEEESNTDYLCDLAGRYFNTVRLERLADGIKADLENGNFESADTKVARHGRVDLGVGAGIDVLQDQDAIREAFEEKREPLIHYDGALGQFMGSEFERDGFMAFMGAEKKGKSFFLLDVAWRALGERRKVVFFSAGDMSQNQLMRRLMSRASHLPLKAGDYSIPKKFERENDEQDPEAVYDNRHADRGLDWRDALKGCEKTLRRVKSRKPMLRLSCHPAGSLSVAAMKGILLDWEREDWTPDVIVIDYADILAPPSGVDDKRERINQTWMDLRGLSQKLHCLVVTGTQASAASYGAWILSRTHFTDDKRKLAHVTGMIGINRTEDEKKQGIYRLNWIARREDDYSETKCIWTVGCLPICHPAMLSSW